MNEHIIIGYLGKDPEVRFTQSGKAVTTLSVGCNRSYVDGTGERQQLTDWVRVVAFLWGWICYLFFTVRSRM